MDKNIKTALIIGGIIVAILIIVPMVSGAIWGWQGDSWGMMGPGMMGFGWEWFMPIFWILFLGLLIWGVVALVRGTSRSSGADSGSPDSALEILKRRYARGEINREEFDEKKKDLV
jgi:putative membrane protein